MLSQIDRYHPFLGHWCFSLELTDYYYREENVTLFAVECARVVGASPVARDRLSLAAYALAELEIALSAKIAVYKQLEQRPDEFIAAADAIQLYLQGERK